MSTNWTDVLDSAERIFSAGAPYLQLPVHMLYTIPPALVFRRFEDAIFFPMIKLQDKAGKDFAPGLEAVKALIRARVPDKALQEMLGENDWQDRLERLIKLSGGYPREVVRLIRNLIASPSYPVSEAEFGRIMNEPRDGFRKIIFEEAYPWLAQVATERYLVHQDESQRETVDSMLSNNVILRYYNNEEWFELHPAVYEIPEMQDAIAAHKKSQSKREDSA